MSEATKEQESVDPSFRDIICHPSVMTEMEKSAPFAGSDFHSHDLSNLSACFGKARPVSRFKCTCGLKEKA